MVNYKLGFVDNNGSKPINISKSLKSLENIDNFTQEFKNEYEFIVYLMNKGLLSKEDVHKKIKVIYNFKGEKTLPVAYSETKKYFDLSYLRSRLLSLGKCDQYFLSKLRNHYDFGNSDYNPQSLNILDIGLYLSDVRRNGGVMFESSNLDAALNDLYKKAVFKKVNENGEIKENYRGIRDLALFISNYESKAENITKNTNPIKTSTETSNQSKPEIYEGKQLTILGTEDSLSNKNTKIKKR